MKALNDGGEITGESCDKEGCPGMFRVYPNGTRCIERGRHLDGRAAVMLALLALRPTDGRIH
jgi:hypothetical protein